MAIRNRQAPRPSVSADGCSNVHMTVDGGLGMGVTVLNDLASGQEVLLGAYLDGKLVGSTVTAGRILPGRNDLAIAFDGVFDNIAPGTYTVGASATQNLPGATPLSSPEVECGTITIEESNGGGNGNGNGGNGDLPGGITREQAIFGGVALGSAGLLWMKS